MRYDSNIHHRRSLRLKGWDYSSIGAYFITICAWKRECIFTDERIKRIVFDGWEMLPLNHPSTRIDEFVLMPNHLHAIIWIGKTSQRAQQAAPLHNVIRAFKSKTAVMINRFRDMTGCPVWQRNYYERIIRDENELNAVRAYIRENPLRWEEDEENPNRIK